MASKAGIVRVNITDKPKGRGAYRFELSAAHQGLANRLYRSIFQKRGMSLAADDTALNCTLAEFEAGYDIKFGVDVVLTFENGMTATMQEKFLFTTFDTVTVEYMNDWQRGVEGDWFTLRCNYYFVGYNYGYKPGAPIKFDSWIMADWFSLQKATLQGKVTWEERRNDKDGAKASFRYAKFSDIARYAPEAVIFVKARI